MDYRITPADVEEGTAWASDAPVRAYTRRSDVRPSSMLNLWTVSLMDFPVRDVPNDDPGPWGGAPVGALPPEGGVDWGNGWRKSPEGVGIDAADITADMEAQYRWSVG